MRKLIGLFASLASVVAMSLAGTSLQAGFGSYGGSGYWGGGSSGYGSSGGYAGGSSGYGYGSSGGAYGYGSTGYAGYGSSGTSGYGSSGYSAGYGSSGTSGYGSSGYSAGYGSSGYGSSGNAGRSHVGPLRRLGGRLHAHHDAKIASRSSYYGGSSGSYYGGSSGSYYGGGSSGSSYSSYGYGSSGGGSSGSYGYSGYGSSGYSSGFGSSGSVYQSSDVYSDAPAYSGGTVIDNGMPMNSGYIANGNSDSIAMSVNSNVKSDEIHLNVIVPGDARVFVNGNATTSKGESRRFVSRGLEGGTTYRFELRAEREVDGKTVRDTKTLVLVPGTKQEVAFALVDSDAPADTVLTLNVPVDATVVLAGNTTKSQGETRVFRTKELKSGEVWEDYTIQVTANGVTKDRTIRLIGGDDLSVNFNFESEPTLASK